MKFLPLSPKEKEKNQTKGNYMVIQLIWKKQLIGWKWT